MMRKFLLFLVIVCSTFLSVAQQRTKRSVNGPRGMIGFYQYVPPGYTREAQKKFPLIIFLHGIGEKGTGSASELEKINCCGIPRYINSGHTMEFTWNGKKEGFVVLYPQLYSRYGTWENYYIDEMLKYAKANLNIDTNRIFLTGLSLGGGASFVYASSSVRNAKNLAGLVPVVSPCFMTNGCNIANANLPVLAVHAWDDDKASPYCTYNAIQGINACGAKVHPSLIMYDNGGHYVWTQRAYDTGYNYHNPNVYEWMLAQNRTNIPNIKPVSNAGNDLTISTSTTPVMLNGNKSADADGKIIRYVWQKISGPPYGILEQDITPTPRISGLSVPGVYKFQLRVVDDRAEWSTDTVKITVVDANIINGKLAISTAP